MSLFDDGIEAAAEENPPMSLRDEAIKAMAKALFEKRGWTIDWKSKSLDLRLHGDRSVRESFTEAAEAMLDALVMFLTERADEWASEATIVEWSGDNNARPLHAVRLLAVLGES